MIKLSCLTAGQDHRRSKDEKPFNGGVRQALITIPRHKVIMKYMRFPSRDKSEIKGMIRLQISALVPYTADEVVFDFYELKHDAAGHTYGLVVIAIRELIAEYLDVVRRFPSVPSRLTVSSFSLLGCINHRLAQQSISDQEPVLVVHVGPESVELCVCFDRKIYFSRSLPVGNRESVADQVREIGLTLKNCQKETGVLPRRVFILSANGGQDGLRKSIQDDYGFPVEEWTGEERGDSCPAQDIVDLIPPEFVVRRDRFQRQRAWLQLMCALVIVLGLGFGVWGLQFTSRQRYLSTLEQRIKKADQGMKKERARMQSIRDIRTKVQGRVLFADIVRELYRLLPEGATLDLLQLDADGSLVLEGMAATQADVNIFQTRCVASERFKDVSLVYATKRNSFNAESTEFKIKCQVVQP